MQKNNYYLAFILTTTLFVNISILAQPNLYSGFITPPTDAKAKGLWDWVNGNYSYRQISYELKEMYDKGMGGTDIWDVGASIAGDPTLLRNGPEFLGTESADAIAHAISEGKKLGLEIGLISSSSWNAGGKWVKPEHGAVGIYKLDTFCMGGKVNINMPLPAYLKDARKTGQKHVYEWLKVELINPKGTKVNITKFVQNNVLKVELPKGKCTIIGYLAATNGQKLMVPSVNSVGLMIDHFSAAAQKANMDYIFGQLTPRLGKNLKEAGLHYLYVDSYELKGAAWSFELPKEFIKRRGYSIVPFLHFLFDSVAVQTNDTAKRVMYDYKRTLSDMIIENHYMLGRQICEQYGIGYAAEAAGPGEPVHNCPFESLRSSGVLSLPRGEFWLGMEHRMDADGNSHLDMIKGVACASHIYNQKYVEAESFTTVSMYKEDFNAIKKALDNAFCDGLNRIVLHTFQHNTPEAGKPGFTYPFGTVFATFQPWWQLSKGFFDYVARASYLLQQGNFVGDVLFYYGDMAPNFVKENTYRKLLGQGFDYDVTNSDIILNKLYIKDGLWTLPHGQQYKILVLPAIDDMPLEVLKKLETMVKEGGILLGTPPTKVPYFGNYKTDESALKTITAAMWKDYEKSTPKAYSYGKGYVYAHYALPEVLTLLKVSKDALFTGNAKTDSVKYIHRVTDKGEHIYFISNQNKTAVRFDFSARVGSMQPEIWDLNTGSKKDASIFITDETYTKLPLHLPAHGSIAIVFTRKISQTGQVSFTRNGKIIFPAETYTQNDSLASSTGSYVYKTDKETRKYILQSAFLDLSKSWEVGFPYGYDAPTFTKFSGLNPWNESTIPGIKYFSGTATYTKTFTLTTKQASAKEAYLHVGEVKDMAHVYINGKDAGYLWCSPYQLNISGLLREGVNTLIIDVANGINNRRVGDFNDSNPRKFTNSHILKGDCAWCTDWANVTLMPSGLLDYVKIQLLTD